MKQKEQVEVWQFDEGSQGYVRHTKTVGRIVHCSRITQVPMMAGPLYPREVEWVWYRGRRYAIERRRKERLRIHLTGKVHR